MFQQITIVGRLGRDPEMRYTASGIPVTSFSLATSRRWTGQDGQQQEKTIWFNVTAWRRQAELASQYLTKGRQVLILGEMEEARAYVDRDGNQRASLDVTANQIKFLGSREDTVMADNSSNFSSTTASIPAPGGVAATPAPAPSMPAAGAPAGASAPAAAGQGPTDEEIPF